MPHPLNTILVSQLLILINLITIALNSYDMKFYWPDLFSNSSLVMYFLITARAISNQKEIKYEIFINMRGDIIAVLGSLNGMIGGIILVMPLMALQAGYVLIPILTVLFGLIEYYTCYLLILHLGSCKSLIQSILEHFGHQRYPILIYNIVVSIFFIGILISYFHLIIIQVEGFISPSPFIGLAIFIILMILTIVMRILNFGEKLLALGLSSIVAYCCFLIWAQITAPQGPKSVAPIKGGFVDISSSLVMGYTVHIFITQLLTKTTTPDKYLKIIVISYIVGIVIYTFIGYGCFAIVNREPRVEDPQTISQVFPFDGWQIRFIEGIYFFHLITATPQFCIILRIRALQIFNIQDSHRITKTQLIPYILLYGVGYLTYQLDIKLSTIISLNGSVLGISCIIFMPVALHLKCVYFSKHDKEGLLLSEEPKQNGQVIQYYSECGCKLQYKNKFEKYCELVLHIILIIFGFLVIAYTIHDLFFKQQTGLPISADPHQAHFAQQFYENKDTL